MVSYGRRTKLQVFGLLRVFSVIFCYAVNPLGKLCLHILVPIKSKISLYRYAYKNHHANFDIHACILQLFLASCLYTTTATQWDKHR